MNKLLNLQHLTKEESKKLFAEFSSHSKEHQAALLALLRAKKETSEEILGALDYFKQFSTPVYFPEEVVDIVGTGGDGLKIFNISTAASLIMASCGLKVAKHGGRKATSKAGSHDLIEALGLNLCANEATIAASLHAYDYCYIPAASFNSELKKFLPLRQSLGIPTIFNLLGPLLNPLNPKKLVLGVYRRDLISVFAQVLKEGGLTHALVVHSEEGLDELSISSRTYIAELNQGRIKEYCITPEEFDLPRAFLSDVKGGSPAKNAQIIVDIFANRLKGPPLDIVLLNAAAGLYVGGIVDSIHKGIQQAKNAIESGAVLNLLQQLGRK